MTPEPHPDTPVNWESLKAIKRGGMDKLDDVAIKNYHDAIDRGESREQAEKVFFDTYKILNRGK